MISGGFGKDVHLQLLLRLFLPVTLYTLNHLGWFMTKLVCFVVRIKHFYVSAPDGKTLLFGYS